MNPANSNVVSSRRTTTDEVFDEIYSQISEVKILPGTKLSEVEIARQFGVSRQPVREAFIRLSNAGLLLIRPQRASVVRKISLNEVSKSRFIRVSIELEVARCACRLFKPEHEAAFRSNLILQEEAIEAGDLQKFSKLDAKFHELICISADRPEVFLEIWNQKSHVDRLCALSLNNKEASQEVFEDHEHILSYLIDKNEAMLLERVRSHLSRLDPVIATISETHADYFEK